MVGGKKHPLFVGTSGYCYNHWSNGVFYPKGLKSRDWLAYYAQYFSTVELNVSFYRRPRLEYLRRWAEMTPPDFRFAAKLNRFITHYQKLKSCDAQLAADKVLADGLGEKLAIVLAQLPPSLPADRDLLKGFLQMIKSGSGSWVPKLAVEFRHPSWLTDDMYELLDEFGASVCLADWGECHVTRPNDVSFLYIRRHSGYDQGNYTPDQVSQDAAFIGSQLQAGKQIYIYYNNDVHAYAVKNARELLGAVGITR